MHFFTQNLSSANWWLFGRNLLCDLQVYSTARTESAVCGDHQKLPSKLYFKSKLKHIGKPTLRNWQSIHSCKLQGFFSVLLTFLFPFFQTFFPLEPMREVQRLSEKPERAIIVFPGLIFNFFLIMALIKFLKHSACSDSLLVPGLDDVYLSSGSAQVTVSSLKTGLNFWKSWDLVV